MVSAILLAAGESRRMGTLKQLLPILDKSFVKCCVDNLLASKASEVIVVIGHQEYLIRKELSDSPVKLAYNPDYRQGMATSVVRGIEAISPDSHAALIALVDQPQIGPDILNRIIDAYEAERALIMIPTYRGRNGHPIVLDMRLKDEIANMDVGSGLRRVVHAHEAELAHVDVGSDEVLIDFDYPEDYRRLREQMTHREE